jgi:hypothetical protein
MKKVLWTGVISLIGTLLVSSAAYAVNTTGAEGDDSEMAIKVAERMASMKEYHAARLAAKKEKFRELLEAQGIDPDTLKEANQGSLEE